MYKLGVTAPLTPSQSADAGGEVPIISIFTTGNV